jgi:hypothetical protein
MTNVERIKARMDETRKTIKAQQDKRRNTL